MKKLIILLICLGCSQSRISAPQIQNSYQQTKTAIPTSKIIDGIIYYKYHDDTYCDSLNIYDKSGMFIGSKYFPRTRYFLTIKNDDYYIAVEVSKKEWDTVKVGDKWSNIEIEVNK